MIATEQAERLLSVDHDNAEADAVELQQPNWDLLNRDEDYRFRYVSTLLNTAQDLSCQVLSDGDDEKTNDEF